MYIELVRKAGGVAKDYLALARGLIDLGWQVLLFCPVDLSHSGEAEVALLGFEGSQSRLRSAILLYE